MCKRASLSIYVGLFFPMLLAGLLTTGCLESRSQSHKSPSSEQATNQDKDADPSDDTVSILLPSEFSGMGAILKDAFLKDHNHTQINLSPAPEMAFQERATQKSESIDMAISTDYRTLQKVFLKRGLSTFLTVFAADEIVVAWSQQSQLSHKIHTDNWHHILSRKEIVFGHGNKNTDICGLRTLLVWKLADNYYRSRMKGKTIEQVLTEKKNKIVRPSTIQLLPLLSTGTIDYVFIYRSLAEQHNLPHVRLRSKLNLSDWNKSTTYSHVHVGNRPGEPISLSFTITTNGLESDAVRKFGNFILSRTGQKLIADNGFTPISGGATLFTTNPLEMAIGR